MKSQTPIDVAKQIRLGDLYQSLQQLIALGSDVGAGFQERHLSALVKKYGDANVKWMLGVIAEDLGLDVNTFE